MTQRRQGISAASYSDCDTEEEDFEHQRSVLQRL